MNSIFDQCLVFNIQYWLEHITLDLEIFPFCSESEMIIRSLWPLNYSASSAVGSCDACRQKTIRAMLGQKQGQTSRCGPRLQTVTHPVKHDETLCNILVGNKTSGNRQGGMKFWRLGSLHRIKWVTWLWLALMTSSAMPGLNIWWKIYYSQNILHHMKGPFPHNTCYTGSMNSIFDLWMSPNKLRRGNVRKLCV